MEVIQLKGRSSGRYSHLSEGPENAIIAGKTKKPARKLLGKEADQGASGYESDKLQVWEDEVS